MREFLRARLFWRKLTDAGLWEAYERFCNEHCWFQAQMFQNARFGVLRFRFGVPVTVSETGMSDLAF
jgi:hypothetical protein